jgi:MYXO-CTERM domain-containing protein
MRRQIGLALTLVTIASSASAHEMGIAGEGGQGAASCNDCHSGGSAPKVRLTGPAMLDAGATGTYHLVITGGAAVVGGLGVSVDNPDAVLQTQSDTMRTVDATQLVHNAPVPFTNGTLSFEFELIAPSSASSLTVYAAGNSCDGDGTKLGDQSANTSLAIAVSGAVTRKGDPTPAPMEMPTPPMQTGCSFAGSPGHAAAWFAIPMLALLLRRRRYLR